MKTLHFLFLVLLGLNISSCLRDDDAADETDDLDIQREEEYKGSDIRDHELDLDQ